MSKKAIITGVTGQDGAYLAQFLLEKGYKVYGTYRRSSTPNLWRLNYLGITDQIELLSFDLIDQTSITSILQKVQPDEFYNLAAQSFVGASFEQPVATAEITGVGPLRILDMIRLISPNTRFYQASTSEMFGNSPDVPQSEETDFHPDSPYAIAKLAAHWYTRNYREGYDMFACSGILFNHESPLRGIEFVTKKITDGVARIKMGLDTELRLGNLESKRDWGFAGDYIKAMWLMLQQDQADDYVIGTGDNKSVREFCEVAFAHVGLHYEDHVVVDEKFFRPVDVHNLLADPSKAEEKLGWNPTETSFNELVSMMVEADVEKYEQPEKYHSYFLSHI